MEPYAGFAERSIRLASENLKGYKTGVSIGQSHVHTNTVLASKKS
jgi:hypothetical protein